MGFICGAVTLDETNKYITRGLNAFPETVREKCNTRLYSQENVHMAGCNSFYYSSNYNNICTKNGFTIVFDGRLYNKCSIGNANYSDEENVLDLFLRHKSLDFLKDLNGDYAFCIKNQKTDLTFCARSPLGIRPFYYKINDGVSFASNLYQLIDVNNMKDSINEESLKRYINNFLYYKYKGRLNITPYKNIYKLLPGFYLEYSDGNCKLTEFWKPEVDLQKDNKVYLCNRFREILFHAVGDRLVNCENGIKLSVSGGLDSSSIAFILHELSKEKDIPPVDLYHNIYKNRGDESAYARYVSEETGFDMKIIEHAEKSWFLKGFEPLQKFVLPINSILYGNSSKEDEDITHIPAVFTGVGGDQLLISSPYFLSSYIKKLQFGKPLKYSRLFAKEWDMNTIDVFFKYAIYPLFNYKTYEQYNIMKMADNWGAKFTLEDLAAFDVKKITDFKSIQDEYEQFLICDQWSENYYSHIDARHPFLDTRLIEFCFSLPGYYKCAHNYRNEKMILREALKDVVGKKIIQRDNKGTTNDTFVYGLSKEWGRLSKRFGNFYLEKMGFIKNGFIEAVLNRAKRGIDVEIVGMLQIMTLELWLESLEL